MIGRLTGTLLECHPGQVLLDVGGVGYTLQIPLSTFYVLSHEPGPPVSLLVHTHVRDDALQLFGFAAREEREVFEKLIAISGVGPRLALAILSGIDADELRRTIQQQDRARLQRIPGVGRKTAERVLLELRDKIVVADAADGSVCVPTAGSQEPTSERRDAISALVNLGYSEDAAGTAVDRARQQLGAEATLESLLRTALGRSAG